MSIGTQALVLTVITIALYVALPAWLLLKGWLIRAGLLAVAIAMAPSIWQSIFWREEAGSFSFLVILLFLFAVILIAVGIIAGATRFIAKRAGGARSHIALRRQSPKSLP